MTLEWPWPILRQGQIWKLKLFYRKKWKQCFFFRNYWSQLIDFMKVCEYWRSRSLLDLGPSSCTTVLQQWIFQKLLKPVTWKLVDTDNLLKLWRYVSIEGQGHSITIYFSRFCMFCALQGQDIRWAFTGPLVLWFFICENKDADQLRGYREAEQRLCFCYIGSTIPLLPKYKISSF